MTVAATSDAYQQQPGSQYTSQGFEAATLSPSLSLSLSKVAPSLRLAYFSYRDLGETWTMLITDNLPLKNDNNQVRTKTKQQFT